MLPRKVSRWLHSVDACCRDGTLVASHDGARLLVRIVLIQQDRTVGLLLELIPRVSPAFGRGHGALTARENDVLRWIAAGKSNAEMARILGLSTSTVGKHLEHIFCKVGVENRTSAASYYAEPVAHANGQVRAR
jgi:DNA-binding CsgD family transcriptional regulator